MGGLKPHGGLPGQQPGDGAQVPTRAEDMEHPVTLGGQPAVHTAAGPEAALQQGSVQIGHQNQLGPHGQRRREMLLEADSGRLLPIRRPWPPYRTPPGGARMVR